MAFEYLGAGSGITKGLYHLNGNSNDSSGNGNNGTDTNISYVAGKFGQCASNTIITPTQYITTTNSGLIRTVSFWIKGTTSGGQIGDNTCERGDIVNQTSNGNDGFLIRRGGNTKNIYYYLGTDYYWNNNSSNGLLDQTWHHLVFTTDGTNTYLYTDGILTYTHTSKTWTTAGVFRMCGTPYGNRHFGGLLDEVIVENLLRDAARVKKYYTYTKGRFGIT